MSKAFPPALERLIKNLSRLPGIGEKTATRYALQILRWQEPTAQELAVSIAELHRKILLCSTCFAFSEQDPCPICSDSRRNRSILCVVEGPADLLSIESSNAFNGLYHVLHGALSPADGIGPAELRIDRLLNRLETQEVKELVLATSSTVSGEATAAYLAQCCKGFPVSVTRLACGIPMGMDVKYADQLTLKRALEARFSY